MDQGPFAIDLFSGGGGFTQGLKSAGYDVRWAIDNNPVAVETYKRNHGDRVVEADIQETDPEIDGPDIQPGELDLVAGGPPCPSFSKIGRSKLDSIEGRSSDEDERNVLYLDFLRYVDYYRPTAFVMENVPGLLHDTAFKKTDMIQKSLDGKDSQDSSGDRVREQVPVTEVILDDIEQIGYRASYQKVDAAKYGVPQHRERVFFIGVQKDDSIPDLSEWRTHREPKTEQERKITVRQNLGAFQPSQQTVLEEKQLLPEFERDRSTLEPFLTVADAIMDLPPVSPQGEMPPKAATEYTLPPISPFQKWLRHIPANESTDVPELRNHSARQHNHLDLSIYKLLGHGVGWNIGDVSMEVQPYRDDVFSDRYKKQDPSQPASTILAHIQKDGHMFIHPTEARSLTVREAARLQSFRDSYWLPDGRTNAYRLVGNAVPPRLGQGVATAIRDEIFQ